PRLAGGEAGDRRWAGPGSAGGPGVGEPVVRVAVRHRGPTGGHGGLRGEAQPTLHRLLIAAGDFSPSHIANSEMHLFASNLAEPCARPGEGRSGDGRCTTWGDHPPWC